MQGTVVTTNWLFEPPNVAHGCSWHSVVTVQLTSVCLSQNIRPVYLLLQSLWTVLKHKMLVVLASNWSPLHTVSMSVSQ